MKREFIKHGRASRRQLLKFVSAATALQLLGEKIAFAKDDLFDGPIRLISPFPAGGPTDSLARVVAENLSQILALQVYVENKLGVGGILGMDEVAKAEPNARTIVIGSMGTMAVTPFIHARLPYHPVDDFQSVALVSSSSNIMIVPKDSPYRTLKDLVDDAKAHPGKLTMGSAGNATSPHLTGALFSLVAGINALHVPYRGSAAALNDMVGGRIDYSFESPGAALPFLQSGKVRPIATAGKSRNPAFPDVPTIAESGYPDFEVEAWAGIYTTAGSPKDRVEALNRAINVALRSTSLKKFIEDGGGSAMGGTIEEADALFQKEFARWPPVLKAADLHAE